ncbi:putative RNA helicase [Helianthus annuus]|nr:putative RNA helicase [Helianthus annuus]
MVGECISGASGCFCFDPACVQRCLSSGVLQAKGIQESLSILVLDEADLLFTYGYEKNLKDLKAHIPKRCQCLLMSATSRAVNESSRVEPGWGRAQARN